MLVIKNFLPNLVFTQISNFLKVDAKWSFSGKSRDDDSESFWYADLSETFAPEEIKIALHESGFFVTTIHAVYANGQSRGQSGGFNVDSKVPGIKTCIIYCNDEWRAEWGGETLFIAPDSSLYDGFFVSPEPNKAVIFDGCLMHKGCAPENIYSGLRKTIAFKFS
jgi:hypothetical protein